ncbi:bifunctional SulP family inorganic anion transporter/carbonic anhydrase [Actinokineospora sp. UTMC 2448]|uniref:bifunctional SulP family inorganic anion transporter/carbonic anhydrase n=1 Tax=Actinokineospora sp. UTMC 2448 TaxID=2268449 RepID=UPI002164D9A4|nr:bifunctional SulP family inorganic anion transporter/carbonic anhydrase [Actinokineospora sp. UTMC 2448]UVS80997.1 Bicarbonate transporter BicA [Actinokineospora sp. UTMC 2448]
MGGSPATGPAHAHSPPLRRWLAENARHDIPASLIVFLVAVPLSLGIAAASGAPVLAGLIAAVVGGVVAGLFGGSPLQVSGPAAGLTVVVADLIARFGWTVTCAITVIAGVLQVVLGACRVGRAALAVSPTVVHAMLAGIGVTIVLGQAHVLLGADAPGSAWANLTALPGGVLSPDPASALIGVGVVALLLVWPRLPARVRAVPGPLVAITAATALTAVLALPIARVSLPDSPLSALHLPELPDGEWAAFAVGVLTMTLIASVESLLSAVAVGKMRPGIRTDFNRELRGQGLANITSGMIGGLPVTGVIVRSSTNVRAGARTRASAVMHGLWVLLFSVVLVGLVEQIPMAALAGLLVFVGLRLVEWGNIRSAKRHGELAVYLVTISCVVFLDLLQGVLIGLACALLATVRRIVWARVRVEPAEPDAEGRPACAVVVEGTLSFLSVPRLSRMLAQVPEGSAVHLELVVDYLDHAAHDHITAWRHAHEGTGGSVVVDEIGGPGLSARRKSGPAPRWLSPWSHWQRVHPTIPLQVRGHEVLHPLVTGAREYHRRGAPMLRPHLRRLASSQQPHAMFLTCADSRIVPNVITASGPGDLFTVRNIGNLVPDPRDSGDLSVHAGVQYAVDTLGVPVVMVCGHSRCGAMTALLSDPSDDPMGQWLRWANPSLAAWRDGHPLGLHAAADGWSEVDQLAMVNVAVQLETLRRLPVVERSGVRLVGLFFDIPTGTLLMLDELTQRFEPLPGRGALPRPREATRTAVADSPDDLPTAR